jgi:hypothetical protein
MHPSDVELIGYANATAIERDELGALAKHLQDCESCRERLERFEAWRGGTADSFSHGLPDGAVSLAERVYQDALFAARIIPLLPMTVDPAEESSRLAADGDTVPAPPVGLKHLATLYSEKPEIVLRVMRDRQTQEDSLHLLGKNPALVRNVLIHIVDPPMDFVTDHRGVANLGLGHIDDPASLQWQVRLPDATFVLRPLEHESRASAAAREFELAAEGGNRMGVTLDRAAEGMVLRLRPIVIAGREDFERVRLVISQGQAERRIVETRGAEPCVVSRLSAAAPIDIRIFAL